MNDMDDVNVLVEGTLTKLSFENQRGDCVIVSPVYTYTVSRWAIPPSSRVIGTSCEKIVPFYLETKTIPGSVNLTVW